MVKYERVFRWDGQNYVVCLQPIGWDTTLCGHKWTVGTYVSAVANHPQCPLCKKIMMEGIANVKGNNADSTGEDGSTG